MNSKVFIANTSPQTILDDYKKLLNDINYKNIFDPKKEIVLKLNLSWTKFYPACSTPPWMLEGVLKTLIEDGIDPKKIIPVENKTVVTNVYEGSVNNKWKKILDKYNVKMHYLTNEKYIKYKPKGKMLILDKIFPRGIMLPNIIFDKNIIHLATAKMHVFTTTTGTIKNYFGMLREIRHFAHRYIHETIVDLLTIQKEIHPGILGLIDGAVVGKGSGPRAMDWEEKNYIFGSGNLVAVDAIVAKTMGFSPENLKYLKLARDLKLGPTDPEVNIKISKTWGFKRADTFASRGQKFIYHKLPERVEKFLLQSIIAPWSYLASSAYHDYYWYNFIGRKRIRRFLKTSWGKLFKTY
ncbi:DUF362 domain-containing protein [Candidatus Parcubacteria bacterium]|nr:MAG: DUF362 domain-containing protein [Candidatus Parcubacteria bacterium]